MMNFNNDEIASVNLKRKNVSILVEYCIENKIEFSVKPLIARNEDFEMDFNISNTKKAVALGMYLKELRLELNGVQPTIPTVVPVAAAPAPATRSTKKTATPPTPKENGHAKEEALASSAASTISFGNDSLAFDTEQN